ncbi:MAG TPA: hypothetical protein VFF04_04660, partial [Candidatus Babeliales bacterium]|nr:hypothetical protein [Candidatus Babeliales bacterium]
MKKPGYILVLTIMIIGLSVVIITYVNNKVTAYSPFAQGFVEREKAHELALAGVQIAMSQLAGVPQAATKSEGQKQDEATKDSIALLKTILPVKNQWQEFALTKARDGVTGTIQICLVSEDGKIDINELYDFEKQQFVQEEGIDVKKGLQVLFATVEKASDGKDLFQAFEKFLKDRQYKLQDVTELLTIKEFEVFKRSVFYEPPGTVSSEKQEKRPVYLTDIFTVWSGSMQLEPWLLSHSLGVLL